MFTEISYSKVIYAKELIKEIKQYQDEVRILNGKIIHSKKKADELNGEISAKYSFWEQEIKLKEEYERIIKEIKSSIANPYDLRLVMDYINGNQKYGNSNINRDIRMIIRRLVAEQNEENLH